MIFAVLIAIVFIALLVQFALASTFIVGKKLFQNLFLLFCVVVTLWAMPNMYGILAAVFLYAVINLITHYSKKIAKH
jgi:hypothetical protein